ncbi:MAG: hypothetical protein IPL52_16410 [Flavobacteriales bacterium]|nr:hypothetical protein [Flavobacteriales bacterium]
MMGPRWSKRVRITLIATGAFWFLVVLFAHPFFAVTAPSGGHVLVVEGWMHEEGLKEAAKLFRSGSYERLCLTGTVRPFAYYLGHDDTLMVRFAQPVQGELLISTAGLPRAGWSLRIDSAETAFAEAKGTMQDTKIRAEGFRSLVITASSPSPPSSGEPVVFVGALQLDGRNAHTLDCTIELKRSTGEVEAGQPTFGHQAFHVLRAAGIPQERMTVVPTWNVKSSRTLSTARDFAAYADSSGLRAFDVATLAVHARRTRNMYRKAFGTKEGIGIIAMHDRWCQRWSWWANYYGWYQMLKELVAWPAPWLIDDTDTDR